MSWRRLALWVGLLSVALSALSISPAAASEFEPGPLYPQGFFSDLLLDSRDVDKDGYRDAITSGQADVGCFCSAIRIRYGGSEGLTARTDRFFYDANAQAPTIADINRDGRPDFVIPATTFDAPNGGDRPGLLTYVSRRGAGTWVERFREMPEPLSSAAGDFDEDGMVDVAVADDRRRPGVTILGGRGRGRLEPSRPRILLSEPAHALQPLDADEDGVIDLVARGDERLSLLRGDGAGGFEPATALPIPQAPCSRDCRGRLTASDLDRDGDRDLIVSAGDRALPVINGGDGTFAAAEPVVFGDDPSHYSDDVDIEAADMNGDRRRDLIIADWPEQGEGTEDFEIWLGDGEGGFVFGQGVPATDAWGVEAVDQNRDGLKDLLTLTNAPSEIGSPDPQMQALMQVPSVSAP